MARLTALVLLALGFAGLSKPAWAQQYYGTTLSDYEQVVAGKAGPKAQDALRWCFEGIATAVAHLNFIHLEASSKGIFCLPNGIDLDRDRMQALLVGELARDGETWRRTPTIPIEQIIVRALARRYPCR